MRGKPEMAVFIMVILMLIFGGCQKKETAVELKKVEEQTAEESGLSEEKTEDSKKAPQKETSSETVFVHVCGQVCTPGVYELPAGSRIFEAVQQAGGFTGQAASDSLNQAEKVEDGQRIYVPSMEEAAQGTEQAAAETGGGAGSPSDGKVNLNTADAEELTTLTGIGQSRAEAIIRYREENGKFQSTEELMNVQGIKEGIYEKIKEQIKI